MALYTFGMIYCPRPELGVKLSSITLIGVCGMLLIMYVIVDYLLGLYRKRGDERKLYLYINRR